MSRSNYDKPFYVDVGTSIVAVRCASNHDVVCRRDHGIHPSAIKLMEDACDRMNREAEQFYEPNGNAAAMREACVKALEELERCHKCDDALLHFADIVHVGNAKRELQEASKKPPRNCDVGTAEEQYERWQSFCGKYDDDCTGCPCDEDTKGTSLCYCFSMWAQMPYEEEAAP